MLLRKLSIILILFSSAEIFCQGKVYFAIGSDTGIWQGLDVSRYTHHYNQDLYTNPERNAYKVMDPAFRNQMTDSYGTPMKLTWWMMAGNTFRIADNTNVPYVNSTVFHLMKKYHGESVLLFDDELSLHYHTFTWTDYDEDGTYWWNQALTYSEFEEDFKYTLAQVLLDENIFPVSYRSGWHYMDNDWQNYLEYVLPFSLHNDYPNKHNDTEEPLDNIYDWSQAAADFVPYHPAADNYQLPGNLNGYNVRSVYTKRFSQEMSNQVFQNAANGTDQLVCFWSHLPENDFLDQLRRVDSLIQNSADSFSNVNYMYCNGVEAYQQWLGTNDLAPPTIRLTSDEVGDNIYFNIQTDEQIFQTVPFVAVKNIYEHYSILPCTEISTNNWRTNLPADKNTIVKVGAAVTDTSGNLSTKFIKYLPDDVFVDNMDFEYQEIYGNWTNSNISAWGTDSRQVTLNQNDSAKARWSLNIEWSLPYNIYFQIPEISDQPSSIQFDLLGISDTVFSKIISNAIEPNNWTHIATALLDSNDQYFLDVSIKETGTSPSWFVSDVIKISAIIKDRELTVSPNLLDFGTIAANDTAISELNIQNNGINSLEIYSLHSAFGFASTNFEFPNTLSGMSNENIPIKFFAEETGPKTDTLIIQSNDPVNPVFSVVCRANVEPPFFIVDNDDPGNYYESGVWATSVAQAYGLSSRYSAINQNPFAYAEFSMELNQAGVYDVFFILPQTVNSSNQALYTISINGIDVQSKFIDQNENSGNWVFLFRTYLPAETPVKLKVEDTGSSTVGVVLRADAVKFSMVEGTTGVENLANNFTPSEFKLEQNFPNPFNPSTVINYQIRDGGLVSLKIYDILGNEISTLINDNLAAGYYRIEFNASQLSSGVYFYRLTSGQFIQTKKMMILK